MRAKTLQIVWHSKEPVFSVDFHPSGVLCSGGGDKDIKLWEVKRDGDGNPEVNFLGDFGGLSKVVNCVRFSPTGEYLASGGDDGEVLLWKPVEQQTQQPAFGQSEGDGTAAGWKVTAALRGHFKDVQDLCWSPDSSALVSGSIENACVVWDVQAKKGQVRLDGHHHYVQGVAWDPLNQFVATQSGDRTCRIYGPRPPAAGKKPPPGPVTAVALSKELVCQCTLAKRIMAAAEGGAGEEGGAKGKPPKHFLFHDENLSTFFRRLSWSPDGSFLVLPAGMLKMEESSPTINATYIYARGHWSQPVLALPSLSKPVVAVRFCPVIFELKQQQQQQGGTGGCADGPDAAPATLPYPFNLPYRLVFAVATLDSVFIYDTQTLHPLAILGPLHYAAITDLTWSPDASFLAVSSLDGYCSIAAFEQSELGNPIPLDKLPKNVADCLTGKAQPTTAAARTTAAAAAAAAATATKAQQALPAQQQQPQQQPLGKASSTPVPSTDCASAPAPAAAPSAASAPSVRRIQPVAVVPTASSAATTAATAPVVRRIQPVAVVPTAAARSSSAASENTAAAAPPASTAATAAAAPKPARRIQPMLVSQPTSQQAVASTTTANTPAAAAGTASANGTATTPVTTSPSPSSSPAPAASPPPPPAPAGPHISTSPPSATTTASASTAPSGPRRISPTPLSTSASGAGGTVVQTSLPAQDGTGVQGVVPSRRITPMAVSQPSSAPSSGS